MSIIFFILKFIEFAWQMLLGSEIPAVVSRNEVLVFLTYSILSLVSISLLLKYKATKRGNVLGFIVISVLFLALWCGAVVDSTLYIRDLYLTYARFIGLITTIIALIQSVYYNKKVKATIGM